MNSGQYFSIHLLLRDATPAKSILLIYLKNYMSYVVSPNVFQIITLYSCFNVLVLIMLMEVSFNVYVFIIKIVNPSFIREDRSIH